MYRQLAATAYFVATIILNSGNAHAFTITNVTAVTLFDDGKCTTADRTAFRWTHDETGTVVDRVGGGVSYDTYVAGWVDGANKIIGTYGVDIEVGNTQTNRHVFLYTNFTPTVGPYRRFLVDLIGTSVYPAGLTQGNTYDPTGHTELLNEEFDANALDIDCPAAVAAGATVEATQKVISEFMSNRANHILGNQPDLIGFINRTNISTGGDLGTLSINTNQENLRLAFATSRSKIRASALHSRMASVLVDEPRSNIVASNDANLPGVVQTNKTNSADEYGLNTPAVRTTAFDKSDDVDDDGLGNKLSDEVSYKSSPSRTGTWDVWTEFHGSVARTGVNATAAESSLWVGYVGMHYFLSQDTLIGVLAQMDWAEETNASLNSSAEGTGWMVGPYIAGKVTNHNLYYQARASWGQSNNDVSPIGTYTDGFDTTRWLASAKISGLFDIGNDIGSDTDNETTRLRLAPEASISYFEETQESYTDSITQLIPQQTISLGEIRFGPNLIWDIKLADGTMFQPKTGISGVYNFGINNNVASQGFVLGNSDLRARLDGGINITNPSGWMISASAFYDGVGIDNYDAYGGSIKLTVPLN